MTVAAQNSIEGPAAILRPRRYLIRMMLFLGLVLLACIVLYPSIESAFLANPVLNGLIIGVLLIGILYIFRQVLTLRTEAVWLESYQSQRKGQPSVPEPKMLAPMARMLGERKGKLTLSALSMRSLLDGIAARLDESRELSRYLIGLLIFLGLLGTFWGLLQTVSSVGEVIGNLSVEAGNVALMFTEMKAGLQQPLAGMGTAFSSSLFGLAGSLVLGFLELQASQAQNRFYNNLEDWLSGVARLSSGGPLPEGGDMSVPAYLQALLEQTAENLDSLQRTVAAGEESRRSTNNQLMALTERLTSLSDQMRTEQNLLIRLAEGQSNLQPILERLSKTLDTARSDDDTTAQHVRNIEVYLGRLVDDLATGRTQAVKEIRSEIKLLIRTITALSEETDA